MGIFEKLGIKRTAKTVAKRALLLKGATIATAGLIAVVGVTYAIAVFFEQAGSFTVKLSKYDMMQVGLTLSETKVFEKPIARLSAKPLKSADNISVHDLPTNLDSIDGDHSDRNYVAYTFYLKNTGKSTCTYDSALTISGVTQGIDEAIRVRIYENGKPTDYAKKKKDGNGAESGTTPFSSQLVVHARQVQGFEPQAVDKYTVVIWLEGDDPECVDSIIGGTIKLQMDFKVTESS